MEILSGASKYISDKSFPVNGLSPTNHINDELIIIIVNHGVLAAKIEDEEYIVNENTILFIFPGLKYAFSFPKGECPDGCIQIVNKGIMGNELINLQQSAPRNPLIDLADCDHKQAHLVHAMEACSGMDEEYGAHLGMLLYISMKDQMVLKPRDAKYTDCFKYAVSFVQEHFTEDITLDDVAKAAYVNKYTLSKLFSTKMSMGFRRYLNQMRLDYAVELLKNTDLSVLEICFDSGYNSIRTFNSCFKTAFGISPNTYRSAYSKTKEA